MSMTPNEIEILLHFHVSSTQHPRQDAPAVVDATAMMLRNALIERAGRIPGGSVPPTYGAWKTTERGAVLVAMLRETPLPVCQWVDPRTGQAVRPDGTPAVGVRKPPAHG